MGQEGGGGASSRSWSPLNRSRDADGKRVRCGGRTWAGGELFTPILPPPPHTHT